MDKGLISKRKKVHHKKTHTGNRIRYNPKTSRVDNPEIKYTDVGPAEIMGKLINQIDALEHKVSELSSEVSRLKKKIRSIGDISGRVTILEADTATTSRAISGMRNDIAINTFDAHADDDLREYMMEERTKDATDTMMSGHEIGAKLENMKQRRRDRGLQ